MQKLAHKRVSGFVTTRQLADAVGFKTTEGVVRFLKKEKCARKIGGRWKIDMKRLAAHYPEILDNLAAL